MSFATRRSWVALLATLLVVAAGVMLGEWQRGRAAQKDALARLITQRQSQPVLEAQELRTAAAEQVSYRHVRIRGQFVQQWPVYLENRPHAGVAGFYLLMPFRLAGSEDMVMVMRGWLPRDPADRTRLPRLKTPSGEVELTGEVRPDAGKVLQLGEPARLAPAAIVQNLDLHAFSNASGLKLLPLIIAQTSEGAANDGLIRDWPLPSSGADKHKAYALQWYGLAAVALLLFLVTRLRRGK